MSHSVSPREGMDGGAEPRPGVEPKDGVSRDPCVRAENEDDDGYDP